MHPTRGRGRFDSLVREVLASLQEQAVSALTSEALARDMAAYDSEIPMKVEILRHVERELPLDRVLEIGAYFGLTSCCVRRLGAKRAWALDTTKAYMGDDHRVLTDAWKEYGLEFVDSDVQEPQWRLEFEDAFFDLVLIAGVMEHLPHSPRRLLEESRRVLRPGGALILTTPNGVNFIARAKMLLGRNVLPAPMDEFYGADRWFGHHREYDRRQVYYVLERAGLRVEVARFVDVPIRGTRAGAAGSAFRLTARLAAKLVPSLRAGLFFLARQPDRT